MSEEEVKEEEVKEEEVKEEEVKTKRTFIPFTKELQDSIVFSLKEITIKVLELENRITMLEKNNE